MITKHKTHSLIAVFLMALGTVYSQTIKSDLAAISKKYNSAKAYEMDIEVKAYQNITDVSPKFTSIGKTLKNGFNYYVSMLNRKIIVMADFIVIVDEAQKMIMYSKITPEQLKNMSVTQTINFDSLIQKQQLNARSVPSGPSEKKIEVLTKGEEIESTTITFDAYTLALKEITYLYSKEGKTNTDNAKVVITYPVFLFEAKHPELLNQSKYIVRKGTTVTPTALYKNYKIINSEDFKYE